MTIEKLIEMGYSKTGEVDDSEIWDNFHSKSNVKTDDSIGFIFQFNLKLQKEPIGQILITKELLKKIIDG